MIARLKSLRVRVGLLMSLVMIVIAVMLIQRHRAHNAFLPAAPETILADPAQPRSTRAA
ncbi:MAG: hypothetical protein KGQ42_06580 [Alphaproteobacteria bacterium]|nr:hypothetical protein [Alphaproteobacteria bacterium]MDE2043310.1 hypothetical protein [Alphaproteobacteria bacterium]MDE2341703.1 hypothetical protein [Alphaproteobacteria bacterium]